MKPLILPIKERPGAIAILSKLCFEYTVKPWSPEITLKEVEEWFDEWLNEEIPLAYGAFDGEKPIGMCSLQYNDGIASDLYPWLGDLCVARDHRGQGVGKQLIDRAKNKAQEQGFKKLYLLTPDPFIPIYYKNLGWEERGMDIFHGDPVILMAITL